MRRLLISPVVLKDVTRLTGCRFLIPALMADEALASGEGMGSLSNIAVAGVVTSLGISSTSAITHGIASRWSQMVANVSIPSWATSSSGNGSAIAIMQTYLQHSS